MRTSLASLLALSALAAHALPSDLLARAPELARLGLHDAELRALAECHNNSAGLTGPTRLSPRDLAQRNAFVQRDGTHLSLLGEPFRVVGGNIYWLGLDENVIPDPSYPSKGRVLEAFGIVSAMRATTVRAHTLGVSFGTPLSVETDLDVFNDAAYEAIDFAVLAARLYGIKLLIPLVDNYNWYHGGKYQFINWHGIPFQGTGADITPPDVGAFFYNTTAIVDSFKRYIDHHLNHVNQFTGIALKDDPTILGWESGNELSAARFGDGPAPAAWTKDIAAFVKNLAPKQLFMDGTYGIFPESGQLENEQVDLFSDHFYPPNITKYETGRAQVNAAGRAYVAGEYDWTGLNGGDDLATWLKTIADSGEDGDLFWSVFGHDDQCCAFVLHDDGESFYYNRDAVDKQRGAIMVQHALDMTAGQGQTFRDLQPAVACPQFGIPASVLPARMSLPSF